MGRADVYSQPDAPDPVLPAALVLELSRRHLPDGLRLDGAVKVEVDESGGEARAYLLDGALDGRGSGPAGGDGGVVVKTQRPNRLRPRTSLAKEAALLTGLAGPLARRIPRVYGYDRVDTDVRPVEFIVMSRIPGRPAGRAASAPPAARRELLGEVAAVLRVVHAFDVSSLRSAGLLPADEGPAGLRARLEPNFADLVESLAGRPGRWPLDVAPERITELALAALPQQMVQQPVALHSNPGPTHAFTDSAGAFTGLIDFGDAYASHPALDLKSWPDPDDRITLGDYYLQGRAPSNEWDAVWTTAMIYADLAALAGPSPHAQRAVADLAERLAQV